MQFKAKFFDGTQARAFQVDVTVYAAEVQIVAEGAPPIVWQLQDIIILDRYNKAHPAKLSCKTAPDARLVVNDAELWLALQPSLQTSSWQSSRLSASWLSILGYAILAGLVITLAMYHGPRLAGHLAVLVPENVERDLGRDLLENGFDSAVCIADDGQAAFAKLWKQMDSGIESGHHYIPMVIKESDANAFAVPGGYIVVFSGLLTDVQSQEELLGILAHERGHVAYRHGMRAMMRYLGLATLMQVMLGNTEVISSLGVVGALRFGREDEAEADAFAIEALQNMQINPTYFADFFERRMKEEGDRNGIFEYLSSHPSSDSRIKKIRTASAPDQRRKPLLTEAELQALKNICSKTRTMKNFLAMERAKQTGDTP